MGSIKDLRATGSLLPASMAGKPETPAECRDGDSYRPNHVSLVREDELLFVPRS